MIREIRKWKDAKCMGNIQVITVRESEKGGEEVTSKNVFSAHICLY